MMTTIYFKRYRMETELPSIEFDVPNVPETIQLLPWSPQLVRDHAKVKFESFRDEMDVSIFPCLGRKDGCIQLMNDLVARKDFVPEATWLAVYKAPGDRKIVPVGTIQGLRTSPTEGAIQNIGIVPGFRGLGLGSALIWRTLTGFALAGCRVASLEVTVHNSAAIRLYERLGFHRKCTVFKVGEVSYA